MTGTVPVGKACVKQRVHVLESPWIGIVALFCLQSYDGCYPPDYEFAPRYRDTFEIQVETTDGTVIGHPLFRTCFDGPPSIGFSGAPDWVKDTMWREFRTLVSTEPSWPDTVVLSFCVCNHAPDSNTATWYNTWAYVTQIRALPLHSQSSLSEYGVPDVSLYDNCCGGTSPGACETTAPIGS